MPNNFRNVTPELVSVPQIYLTLMTFASELINICFIYILVHGQVTIIFVVSVGCLSVCLFVCAVFFSAVSWSDYFDQTRTYVICLSLVVSPRIWGLCDPWGLGDPQKTCIFRGFGMAVNHHSVASPDELWSAGSRLGPHLPPVPEDNLWG